MERDDERRVVDGVRRVRSTGRRRDVWRFEVAFRVSLEESIISDGGGGCRRVLRLLTFDV